MEEEKKRPKKKKTEEAEYEEVPRRVRRIKLEEQQREEAYDDDDDASEGIERQERKRPKLQEGADVVRGRGKRRRRGCDEADADVFEAPENLEETSKKTRQRLEEIPQKSKKNLTYASGCCENVAKSAEKANVENSRRTLGSRKNVPKGVEKVKVELSSDSDSVTSTGDALSRKGSKKLKRGKLVEESDTCLVRDEKENSGEDTRKVRGRKFKEPSVGNEEEEVSFTAPQKRSSKQKEVDDREEGHSSKEVKKSLKQEKKSQEKEVSTSSVIDVENDNEFEGSEHDSDVRCENNDDPSAEESPPPLGCSFRRKRKRHHRKVKGKNKTSLDSAKEMVSEIPVLPDSGTSKSSSDNFRTCGDGIVTASSSKTHIYFPSDDDDDVGKEEVTSASHSCDGNDIEIVGQISVPNSKPRVSLRKRSSGRMPTQSSFHDEVIDVEKDEGNLMIGDNEMLRGGPAESTEKCSQLKESYVLLENLSTLKYLAENGVFTVVSTTSKKETVTSEKYVLPEPMLPVRRDPPTSRQRELSVSEDTHRIFQNLINLQNQAEPLFLSSSPRMVALEDDDDEAAEADELICAEIPDQSFSSSKQHKTKGSTGTSSESCDLMSAPSASGYAEDNGTPKTCRPGPLSRASRRSAPRRFQSIGKLVSVLKKQSDSQEDGEEELQVVTNDDDPRSPAERVRQNRGELPHSKDDSDDDDVTSTMAEAESSEGASRDEELKGNNNDTETEQANDTSPAPEASPSMQQTSDEEDSKKDILKDVKVCLKFSLL